MEEKGIMYTTLSYGLDTMEKRTVGGSDGSAGKGAAKTDVVSSITRTTTGGDNQLLVIGCPLTSTRALWHICPPTRKYTHINR